MVNGLIVLIAYLFAGDIISHSFDLPIPGGIIGMVLMLITLIIRGKVDEPVDTASRGLIAYIGLLFVPAGVGVSQYFDLLAQEWPIMLFATLSTMFLTLAISALLFRFLSKAERS